MLPHFLIVGAMKSGTSTLRDHLARVDGVFIPGNELHFFSDDDQYARGLAWYERYFEDAVSGMVVGEKTATYSYLPAACPRIHEHLPTAKLIWIFREPVARTYSHYWHSAKHGSDPLTFETAIRREPVRVERDIMRGYQRRSLYVEQVRRYLERFPREQMLFLLFEDLVRRPVPTIESVLRFLGVDGRFEPPAARLHSNATFAPRSAAVQWMARGVFGRGSRGWNVVQRLNRRRQPGYPDMSEELRRQLEERFEEPNRELARLTGLDLGVWEDARRRGRTNRAS